MLKRDIINRKAIDFEEEDDSNCFGTDSIIKRC
ncbi:MAG: hypothetical protein ACI8U0_000341 [Flavobacteriales bacterium]